MNATLFAYWNKYLLNSNLYEDQLANSLCSLGDPLWRETLQHIKLQLCESLHSIGEQCLYKSFTNYLITEPSVEKSFVHFSTKSDFSDLFCQYPALEHLFESRINGALASINRAILDFQEYKGLILDFYGEDCVKRIEISPFLSDPHNGGLQVVRFDLNGRYGFFYKPKSIQYDICFLQMYDHAVYSLSGTNSSFAHDVILNDNSRGFAFVNQIRRAIPEDLKSSFYNSGIMLYIAYISSTTDLINDNIIPSLRGFYPVDIEFFNCPKIYMNNLSSFFALSQELLESSCVDTALLPRWLYDGNFIKDTSGLCSHFLDSPMPRSCIDIDQYGFLKWTHIYEKDINLLRGHLESLPQYSTELVRGFSDAHEYFTASDQSMRGLFHKLLPSYSRFTFRPTMFYSAVLRRSFSPDHCQNLTGREDFISSCLQSSALQNSKLSTLRSIFPNSFDAVIKDELTSLVGLDVPIFYYVHDRKELHCPSNDLRVSFPASFTYQYPRTSKLPSSCSIAAQVNLIRISFSLLLDSLHFCDASFSRPISSPLDSFLCQLNKLVLNDDSFKPDFYTLLQPINIQNVSQIGVSGPGLWNGLCGLLFCLQLLSNDKSNSQAEINRFSQILSDSLYFNLDQNHLDECISQFGTHNLSGISGLLSLKIDTMYKASVVSSYADSIGSVLHDQLSSLCFADADPSCIDLYDGLLGDLLYFRLNCPEILLVINHSVFFSLIESRIDSLSAAFDRSRNLQLLDLVSFVSLLRDLGLAHGLLGSVYALISLGSSRSEAYISQAFVFIDQLALYLDSVLIWKGSGLGPAELQQILSNCNGLGGILLVLSEHQGFASSLSVISIVNYFSVLLSDLLDRDDYSFLDLDFSMCCGLAGNYVVLQTIVSDCQFGSISVESRSRLESLLSVLRDRLYIRLSSFGLITRSRPHNLDISLFKGYGGVLLSYLLPPHRIKKFILLDFSDS